MDLEKRLAMAQLLARLMKQDELIKFGPKKADEALQAEVVGYVKNHLHNLFLGIMGEVTNETFTSEEVAILKQMVTKIRGTTQGAKS